MTNCLDFRIGLTQATMQPLLWYGIPNPVSRYVPYAVVRKGGDSHSRGYGWPTGVWAWEVLTQEQLWELQSLFTNIEDASVELYIRTYKDNGPLMTPADFRVIANRPVDGAGKEIIPDSRWAWASVSLAFAHMVEL